MAPEANGFIDIDMSNPPAPPNAQVDPNQLDHAVVSADQQAPNMPLDQAAAPRLTAFRQLSDVLPSPLRVDRWQHYLSSHPDEREAHYVLNTITTGADIEIKAEPDAPPPEPPNLPSATDNPLAVDDLLQAEILAGRMAGPFEAKPFPSTWVSPLGLVPKSDGGVRMITHLSFPEGKSPNDQIPDNLPCPLSSFDEAAAMVAQQGNNTWMAKIDVKGAFRLVPVRRDHRQFVCYKWRGKYLVDYCLPFGMKSSPSVWCRISAALMWIIKHHLNIHNAVCYVDDFLVTGTSEAETNAHVTAIIALCDELGVPLAMKKLIWATTSIVFLGIGINSPTLMAFVTEERKLAAKELLEKFILAKHCSLTQLQSLLGKLYFLTRVVSYGRAFLSRGVALLRGSKKRRLVRLGSEFRKDLHWWSNFLPRWNGCSLLSALKWSSLANSVIQTDASQAGAGAFFEGRWFSFPWQAEHKRAAFRGKTLSMPYLELLAIVIALHTWAEQLKGRCVILQSDCLPVVQAVRKMYSSDPHLASLIRSLAMVQCFSNFYIFITHITTNNNIYADPLSRLDAQAFKEIAPPHTQQQPSPVIPPSYMNW
jgi:hypothetical protein